jgi:hypothetical protein
MRQEELFALVFTIAMFSGVFIVYLGLRQRSLQLEMRHRERMAMIERGQIPLSEPSGVTPSGRRVDGGAATSRSLSLGIIVVGLGLALMTIIAIAGDSPEIGVGVGGAIAIIGGAFIVRSLIVPPRAAAARPHAPAVPATPSSDDDI